MSSKMFTKSPLNQQQNVQSVRLFDTSDDKLRDGIKIPVKIDKNPQKTDKLRERKQTQLQPHTAHRLVSGAVRVCQTIRLSLWLNNTKY